MLKSLALPPFSDNYQISPRGLPAPAKKLCSAMQIHLSLPLVWHICTQKNNSDGPRGKESFIAEFKSLL